MRARALGVLPGVLATLLLAGCSLSSLDGLKIPAEARAEARYFVKRHEKDERNLAETVAASLRRAGFDATAEEPPAYDYLVTYVDLWYWDMRTYLIDFRVDVREAESGILVATARSFQTSLDAMGHTYQDIIDRAVRVLAEGSPQASQRASRSGE